MFECIGEFEQQIKPVFDVDAYDVEQDIDAIIAENKKMFAHKQVNYAKREPRDYKGKSYRFYVADVRINSQCMPNSHQLASPSWMGKKNWLV